MLADFGSLRRILKDTIAQLDHSNLNDNPVFEQNPSAERIARYIFEEASARLSDPNLLFAVDVFETPGSMARYER
ncbi:hypothetical protein FACS1894172_00410 [Spirochaetia bacterium]|nr:hypothetical protein FACS1894172_00410 [Spirochaetia bacterium]